MISGTLFDQVHCSWLCGECQRRLRFDRQRRWKM